MGCEMWAAKGRVTVVGRRECRAHAKASLQTVFTGSLARLGPEPVHVATHPHLANLNNDYLVVVVMMSATLFSTSACLVLLVHTPRRLPTHWQVHSRRLGPEPVQRHEPSILRFGRLEQLLSRRRHDVGEAVLNKCFPCTTTSRPRTSRISSSSNFKEIYHPGFVRASACSSSRCDVVSTGLETRSLMYSA